jgi:hypothetical protein
MNLSLRTPQNTKRKLAYHKKGDVYFESRSLDAANSKPIRSKSAIRLAIRTRSSDTEAPGLSFNLIRLVDTVWHAAGVPATASQ